MRYPASILILTALLLAPSSSAVILEIPLPELHGDVPADFPQGERQTTVSLPNIASVNSVSFRIAGNHDAGVLECDGQPPSAWPLDVTAYMTPLDGIAWYAMEPMPLQDGSYGWTADFRSIPTIGVSWDHLLDGEETIRLTAIPVPVVGLCTTIAEPTGSVTEAVLILDYEQVVLTELQSWSAIKALYR